MSNVTRVLLNEEVGELVLQADQSAAYAILNRAVDVQEAEGRAMTIAEALAVQQAQALRTVAQVARQVEAIG